MIEGIPAFFASGSDGGPLTAVMAAVFALATMATYVLLCVDSSAGARRLRSVPSNDMRGIERRADRGCRRRFLGVAAIARAVAARRGSTGRCFTV